MTQPLCRNNAVDLGTNDGLSGFSKFNGVSTTDNVLTIFIQPPTAFDDVGLVANDGLSKSSILVASGSCKKRPRRKQLLLTSFVLNV